MAGENRNLFRLTRFILLKLPKLLRFIARFRKPAKRLLIIKTDAIGDYILFRNFIEVTRLSAKYRHHQIDLLGNVLWKDVCLSYDNPYLNETFFIKANSLYYAPFQTLKLGWRLFINNYEVVLQSTYTRTFINDGLAALASAKQTIGFQSDTEGIELKYKTKTDKFYTQKLVLPQGDYFEFDRTKFFFETVLNTTIGMSVPHLKLGEGQKQGIAILPGAGVFKRGWEKEKFLELIIKLLQHSQYTITLIGGPGEVENGDYLLQHLPAGSITSFIGKTSLPQMIEIIGSSALLIANETSAVHIAAATQTPSVCVLGGGHFERFAPYPDHAAFKPVCIYEKMPCYYCNWLCIYKTEDDQPFPCISAVTIDKVWQAVSPLLPA